MEKEEAILKIQHILVDLRDIVERCENIDIKFYLRLVIDILDKFD